MTRIATGAGVLALVTLLAACQQTGAGSVAVDAVTGLDPTGLSGTAAGLIRRAQPAPERRGPDYSTMGSRLSDVAAGNLARPDPLADFDRHAGAAMAGQAASIAQTVGSAAINGALSGGIGLVSAAPSLAMQAATAGMVGSQLAASRSQISAGAAEAEARRAAEQLVPDEDRPAEAQAILSILDDTGGTSATWKNPGTGASGKVSLDPTNKDMFVEVDCRLIRREFRIGKAVKSGTMLACRSNGEWYELS